MSKIILTYFSFVIACLVVIVAFITATSYIQLAVAILLYPLLVFFSFKLFSKRVKDQASEKSVAIDQSIPQEQATPTAKPEIVASAKTDSIGISDIDKRVFLKLIGGAGVFLFLFSIFNKKTESLFYKNLPGSVAGQVALEDINGKKIDPAQNQPLDGYSISEIDDNIISYYGYTNVEGAWFITRIDSDTGTIRYARGDKDLPSNWSSRANLKYDYFNKVFS